MLVVFNSSPLIFLAKLRLLDVFLSEYQYKFYAPRAVFDEIEAKEDEASQYIKQIVADKKLAVRATNLTFLANSLGDRLGKGEAEAISLGTELKTDIIILDDFAARKEALRRLVKCQGDFGCY